MTRASRPFSFVTAYYLTRIDNQRATTIGELRDGLDRCSEASIFYHTFQSLGRHHFLTEGFSNDFAQWALAALNRAGLPEQLASLEFLDYTLLAHLRGDLHRIASAYSEAHPPPTTHHSLNPFYS